MNKGRIFLLQVFVVLLLSAKMAAVGELFSLFRLEGATFWGVETALAEPPSAQSTSVQPPKDVFDEGLKKERDLYALLEQRQRELDSRESALKVEEQRLAALKKEIIEKIDFLKVLEQRISAAAETQKTEETKRFKELAKVYEATPPAKAGPMLEKLDLKTAAGILMNMKREKAGLMWGHLSTQRAVEITKEITQSHASQGPKQGSLHARPGL